MSIVSITWARNEADILESFVRHNSAAVDRIIIVLHKTTDHSLNLLNTLKEEGMPLEIRTSEIDYHAQGEVLTALMHELALAPDTEWILPLDADEFLCGDGNLYQTIRNTAADRTVLLPWKTYVPTEKDHPAEPDVLQRMTFRRSYEPYQYNKVMIPRALAAESTLPMGSHVLLKRNTAVPQPSVEHSTLHIAHFPVRSEQQLKRKIVQGWEAHASHPHTLPDQSYHWKALYERCQDPTPMSTEELTTIALQYAAKGECSPQIVCDPVRTTTSSACGSN